MKSLPRTCSSLSLDHGFHDDFLANEVDETHAGILSSGSEPEIMALKADPSPPETSEHMQLWQQSQPRDGEAVQRERKCAGRMETSGKRITRQRSMLEHQRYNMKLSKRISGSCGTLCDDDAEESLVTTNSAEDYARWHPKAENKQPSYYKAPVKSQRISTTETGKKSSSEEDGGVKRSSRSAERQLRQQERLARRRASNAVAHSQCIQERRPMQRQQSCQNDLGAVKSSTSKSAHHHSSRRKHCDLYKRIAASGQLNSVPVAYGDFGALKVNDVVWQQFCFSQDAVAPLKCSSVRMFNSASQLQPDVRIVRYGFV